MDILTRKYIDYFIKKYLNNRETLIWIENNMIFYQDKINHYATTEQAFSWAIKPLVSIYTTERDTEKAICGCLWELLLNKHHRLTTAW